VEESDKYPGLTITPQVGLLPLGPDPNSGLQEFAHLQTGKAAVRKANGELIVGAETGIVFVLLPGGRFWMGSQNTDPKGQNFDPMSLHDERPAHEVELSPFFLSKYEMTVGQWRRAEDGKPFNLKRAYDDLHPAVGLNWQDCRTLLSPLDAWIDLPSEAQWEYGCRAGTTSVWWTGNQEDSLATAGWTQGSEGLWKVEYGRVGRLAPNGFGLHDVHSNAGEWCLDGITLGHYGPSRDLDPVVPWTGPDGHVGRGLISVALFDGPGFQKASASARSARRYRLGGQNRSGILGLRPARAITP
jgi:formylglycine-generating enzyme required for sulfatase activity